MTVPNWQHHSSKDKKRRLKPQAIRSRRDARRALIAKLLLTEHRTNASDHSGNPDPTDKYNNGGSSARPFSIAKAPHLFG
jgi:hypothetical protein